MRWPSIAISALLVAATLVFAADEPKAIMLEAAEGRLYQLSLNRSMKDLLACYNNALAKQPTLQGKVDFRITVESTGASRTVEVLRDRLGDNTVIACITELLRKKSWPASSGAVVFETSFSFTPAKKE